MAVTLKSITTFISNVRNAVYGKDVRESIAKALEECNDNHVTVVNAINAANEKVTAAQSTLSSLQSANSTATSKKSALDSSISSANTALSNLQAATANATQLANLQAQITTLNTTVSNILNGNTLVLKEEVE